MRFPVRAGFAVASLFIIFLRIDRSEFGISLASINLVPLVAAVALFVPGQLLAAFRWRVVLSMMRIPLPFAAACYYTWLGQLSSLFLPSQLSGDIVRGVAASRQVDGKAKLAFSVVIDKAALLFALGACVLFGTVASDRLLTIPGARIVSALLLVASLALIVLVLFPNWVGLLRERVFRVPWLPCRLNERLASLPTPSQMSRQSIWTALAILSLALLLQLSYSLGSMLIARAFGVVLSPVEWVGICAIVAIAQILPVSIGGLGVRESVFVALLSLYGVPSATTVAFSLTGHVLNALLTATTFLAVVMVRALAASSRVSNHEDRPQL